MAKEGSSSGSPRFVNWKDRVAASVTGDNTTTRSGNIQRSRARRLRACLAPRKDSSEFVIIVAIVARVREPAPDDLLYAASREVLTEYEERFREEGRTVHRLDLRAEEP